MNFSARVVDSRVANRIFVDKVYCARAECMAECECECIGCGGFKGMEMV